MPFYTGKNRKNNLVSPNKDLALKQGFVIVINPKLFIKREKPLFSCGKKPL